MYIIERAIEPRQLNATQCWPLPKDKRQLRSFTLQGFKVGFVDIAKPLIQLMEEKRIIQCFTEADTAFWSQKEALCAEPLLGYYQLDWLIVDTDTPNGVIGCVLSELHFPGRSSGFLKHEHIQG
jgi:hypothetical protein